MAVNRQRNNQSITRQDFLAVQQMRAANQVLGASYARKFREQDEIFEGAIDDGETAYPLSTVSQTLAGAINELKSQIDGVVSGGGGGSGGGGSGNSYFPGGW